MRNENLSDNLAEKYICESTWVKTQSKLFPQFPFATKHWIPSTSACCSGELTLRWHTHQYRSCWCPEPNSWEIWSQWDYRKWYLKYQWYLELDLLTLATPVELRWDLQPGSLRTFNLAMFAQCGSAQRKSCSDVYWRPQSSFCMISGHWQQGWGTSHAWTLNHFS